MMVQSKYEYFRDTDKSFFFTDAENNSSVLHFHRNLEIIYVREGELHSKINGEDHVFSQDEIVFVPQFISHSFNTPEYCKTVVLIIPYIYSADIQKQFQEKHLPYHLTNTSYNRKILEFIRMYQKYFESNSPNEYTIKGFINTLFGLLLSKYTLIPQNTNNMSEVISTLLEYIENNFKDNITLDSLAKMVGYNKDYLSKQFNKCVQTSIPHYINKIRIENAVLALMKSGEQNILAIALDCGFNSLTTFYRAFKEIYNIAPKDYLQNLSYKKRLMNAPPTTFRYKYLYKFQYVFFSFFELIVSYFGKISQTYSQTKRFVL